MVTRSPHIVITVTPRVVAEYEWARIRIDGLADARSVEARMLGASDIRGAVIGWFRLDRQRTSWTARLPQPVLPGIYPIALRTVPHLDRPAPVAYVRVYDQRSVTHPLLATPRQVAAWWVARVAGGRLVAIRRWPRIAMDRRLPSLHRLFVVAYDPRGDPRGADRLGAWLTIVKEGPRGKWHLLEASVTPP
jgi:hypothetical protein